MPDFTFPKLSGYEFLAPRQQVSFPFQTIFAADDNQLHEILNGSYDRHFPLYTLTNIKNATSDWRPSIKLISATGTEKTLKGALTPIIYKDKINRREYGRKENVHPQLGNSGLVLNRIYYREFLIPKFNPKYTLIVDGKFITNTIQKPAEQFIDIGTATPNVLEAFPRGTLVKYGKYYWRCLKATKAYPTATDSDWQQLPERQSVFTADIYSIFGSDVQYLQTYSEDRNFRPEQQDTSLVTYNVSCFYG